MSESRRAAAATIRLANIEEPVASLAGCERLRGEFGVPVSTHCYDLDAISAYPLIDSVVSDIHLHGGEDPLTMAHLQALRAIDSQLPKDADRSAIEWATQTLVAKRQTFSITVDESAHYAGGYQGRKLARGVDRGIAVTSLPIFSD